MQHCRREINAAADNFETVEQILELLWVAGWC